MGSMSDDFEVHALKEEIKALRELLFEFELTTRKTVGLNTRLQQEPLSDDKLYSLYRRTLDWRQFARDIEAEHGVGV